MAIPVVACLMQYLEGRIRKPGLWFQAYIIEPKRFFKDLEKLGATVKGVGLEEKRTMVFMGFKGFRTKYWAVDYQTGLCQGLYEWQTVTDAAAYSTRSIANKVMTNLSDQKSILYRIIDKSKERFEYRIVET